MEEHRIAPETGNVVTNAFAFIVTILITIILADLIQAVVSNLSLSVPTVNDIALAILTVAILLEALVAAFDNYAYTRERYDPLHRGIAKFEIIRHLITFFSIIVLLLGVSSVAGVWKAESTLSTAATVVTGVILIRYSSEFIWQSTAYLRRYYLRWCSGKTVSADGNDPFTDEAKRTLSPLENSVYSYTLLVVISLVGFISVFCSSFMAIDALIAGIVVFSMEIVYLKLWAGYYTELLNIGEPLVDREMIEEEAVSSSGQKIESDAAVRTDFESLVENNDVPPERLARELKVYHEDPRYEFRIGEEGERTTELLELIKEEDSDPDEIVDKFSLTEHQLEEANTEAS